MLAGLATAADLYTLWVEPCPAETAKITGCQTADPELARWALDTWARESKSLLSTRELAAPEHARIRIRWASGAMNLYGETEPLLVEGHPGAQIFVLPDMNALGHEIGELARRDPSSAMASSILPVYTKAATPSVSATPLPSPTLCTASSTAETSSATSNATAGN